MTDSIDREVDALRRQLRDAYKVMSGLVSQDYSHYNGELWWCPRCSRWTLDDDGHTIRCPVLHGVAWMEKNQAYR